jgi:hypothetical protein
MGQVPHRAPTGPIGRQLAVGALWGTWQPMGAARHFVAGVIGDGTTKNTKSHEREAEIAVAVHEARVTSVQKNIKPRRWSPDASVDPTEARYTEVKGMVLGPRGRLPTHTNDRVAELLPDAWFAAHPHARCEGTSSRVSPAASFENPRAGGDRTSTRGHRSQRLGEPDVGRPPIRSGGTETARSAAPPRVHTGRPPAAC